MAGTNNLKITVCDQYDGCTTKTKTVADINNFARRRLLDSDEILSIYTRITLDSDQIPSIITILSLSTFLDDVSFEIM